MDFNELEEAGTLLWYHKMPDTAVMAIYKDKVLQFIHIGPDGPDSQVINVADEAEAMQIVYTAIYEGYKVLIKVEDQAQAHPEAAYVQ